MGSVRVTMKKIKFVEVVAIAKQYGLHPCRIAGTEIINIRKHKSDKNEDIEWAEFERILKRHKLAVYKATESDFLKIMRDRRD